MNINMVSVRSSAISAVGYDASTSVMRIRFKQGSEYDYPDVPAAEFSNLINAESVGKYFNAHIKPYSINVRGKGNV